MKNKSLIFLILSFVMGGISVLCGDILNHFSGCVNTRLYHCGNTNYYLLKSIPVEKLYLDFFNIFFAILFAIFLAISVFMSIKENKK